MNRVVPALLDLVRRTRTTTRALLVALLVAPVRAYSRWISPALPPRCRFSPTCSRYAVTALQVHGPVRGLGLVVWRLLRCQPFSAGGHDPVPPPRRRSATMDRRASSSAPRTTTPSTGS